MSNEIIVKNCSPTLAGIKTGSLFSYEVKKDQNMVVELRRWNKLFVKKGLRIFPMLYCDGRVLLYVYRPQKLEKDLKNEKAREILSSCGYDELTEKSVIYLQKRICESNIFPHEIGLFLGYPPDDVDGFIKNNAKNFKISGLWKVYGDEITAQKLFSKYQKCTRVYMETLKNGSSVERLLVPSVSIG